MNIVLNKEESIGRLRINRRKHIDEFHIQIQGWKKAMEKYNKDLAAWSKEVSEDMYSTENAMKRPNEPRKPINYLGSYDRLIELISANVTDTIVVSEHEYDQIANNKFNWSQDFLTNSATYENS